MSVAWRVEEHQASPDSPCPGCRERDRRIGQLQFELKRYERRSGALKQASLAVGALLLIALPPLFIRGLVALGSMLDSASPLFVMVFYGVSMAGLFSPWAVLGNCAMLSCRPLWQRTLIYPPAFAAASLVLLSFS